MEFFSVFFVVLFVHTGVTLPYRNNSQVVFPEKPTSAKEINFPKSDGAPDTQNYSNDPGNFYSQRQEVLQSIPNIPERGIDKFPSTKDITSEQQGLPSKWDEKGSLSVQHPVEPILARTSTLPQNSKNGQSKGLHNEGSVSNQPNKDKQILPQTANLPRGNIYSSNTENLNSNRRDAYDDQNRSNIKQQPVIPKADTRLDLQEMSLENRKSFIDQSSTGSVGLPIEPESAASTDFNLNKDNSIQYIINKAKQAHNIYASDKNLKRYTIIHPDGTVEHTDDLEKVYVTYPNYVMVKYSDLTKYNTNASEIATELRLNRINQEDNGEMMPKMLNNTGIELSRPETGSPAILRKETLAPEVMSDGKIKEEQLLYTKKNILTNSVNVTNLETMQYESIAPHTKSPSDTVPKTDFPIATPTSVTVPQNKIVNAKETTLKNSTTGPSNSEQFSERNNSDSQDNTKNSKTPSSQQSSPSPSLDDVDYSGIWYQDKDFWDELKNNTQYNLLFFMYVPTAPQVRKEIKTTIYPNGTTLEEVTEIVDGKDGFPVAIKTTKVTLPEDIDKNEKKL